MKLLNAALVAVALLVTLAGYLQEKKRLEKILALPPAAARDLYEKAQIARDRVLMLALFAVLVIVAVGGRASDALRLSQAESILARLPDDEARAYYDALRRRVRKVLLMRALTLISLLCIFWVLRQRLIAG